MPLGLHWPISMTLSLLWISKLGDQVTDSQVVVLCGWVPSVFVCLCGLIEVAATGQVHDRAGHCYVWEPQQVKYRVLYGHVMGKYGTEVTWPATHTHEGAALSPPRGKQPQRPQLALITAGSFTTRGSRNMQKCLLVLTPYCQKTSGLFQQYSCD